MATDLTKPSDQQVLDLLNAENGAGLDFTHITFGEPEVLVDNSDGRNTGLIVSAKPNSGYVGAVSVAYDRLDLDGFRQYGEPVLTVEPDSTVEDVIDAFNAFYDANLVIGDDIPTDLVLPTIDYVGQSFTLPALEYSYAFIGDISITLKLESMALSSAIAQSTLDGLAWPIDESTDPEDPTNPEDPEEPIDPEEPVVTVRKIKYLGASVDGITAIAEGTLPATAAQFDPQTGEIEHIYQRHRLFDPQTQTENKTFTIAAIDGDVAICIDNGDKYGNYPEHGDNRYIALVPYNVDESLQLEADWAANSTLEIGSDVELIDCGWVDSGTLTASASINSIITIEPGFFVVVGMSLNEGSIDKGLKVMFVEHDSQGIYSDVLDSPLTEFGITNSVVLPYTAITTAYNATTREISFAIRTMDFDTEDVTDVVVVYNVDTREYVRHVLDSASPLVGFADSLDDDIVVVGNIDDYYMRANGSYDGIQFIGASNHYGAMIEYRTYDGLSASETDNSVGYDNVSDIIQLEAAPLINAKLSSIGFTPTDTYSNQMGLPNIYLTHEVNPSTPPVMSAYFSGMSSGNSSGDPILASLLGFNEPSVSGRSGYGNHPSLLGNSPDDLSFKESTVTAFFVERYNDEGSYACLCMEGNLPKDYFSKLNDLGDWGTTAVGVLLSEDAIHGYSDDPLEETTVGSTYWVWEVPSMGYWYDGSTGRTVIEITP